MTEIIAREADAKGAPCLRLQIYRSGKQSDRRAVGLYTIGVQTASDKFEFFFCKYGTEAMEAFSRARAVAERFGIPFLWLDDPENLLNLPESP